MLRLSSSPPMKLSVPFITSNEDLQLLLAQSDHTEPSISRHHHKMTNQPKYLCSQQPPSQARTLRDTRPLSKVLPAQVVLMNDTCNTPLIIHAYEMRLMHISCIWLSETSNENMDAFVVNVVDMPSLEAMDAIKKKIESLRGDLLGVSDNSFGKVIIDEAISILFSLALENKSQAIQALASLRSTYMVS